MLIKVMIGAIRLYQSWLSPVLPAACRYQPSCSEYTAQAILTHGAGRGVLLGARRIGRCHPWGGKGFDPVPPVPKAVGRPAGKKEQ